MLNAKMRPAHLKKARFRLACSGGLYLEVSPNGSKRWFWKYRKGSKEGRLALGSYPAVGPKDARKARDAAKAQKSDGHDPVKVRKVEKLKATLPDGVTFKAVTLEWCIRLLWEVRRKRGSTMMALLMGVNWYPP